MSSLWGKPDALWPGVQRFGEDGVPAGQTVRVRRRPRISKPGSTVETVGSWADAEEFTVDGVGLDRMVATELAADTGSPAIQVATIYGPTQADIHKGDRVYFPDGVIVSVDGVPNRQPNMINGWSPPMSVLVSVTHG